MNAFRALLDIIGGNPFVYLPDEILESIFRQAGKRKGHIPVKGTVNGKSFRQTLVKYSGDWRLYINMKMLKDSPRRIGEEIEVAITFDPSDRTIKPHPNLIKALKDNKDAHAVFEKLSPSRQQEIVRYIAHLKTEQSVDRNIDRAINFLLGKGSFVGRKKP